MIDELAIETFNEHTLAGLALGVVRDGALEHFTGLGLADADAGRPVERDTVFRIGSISKTMTAVAVMQLVEEGALGARRRGQRPRDPRARSTAPAPGHRAPPADAHGRARRAAAAVRSRAAGDRARREARRPAAGAGTSTTRGRCEPAVEPGTKWAYANHGFALLGLIVEDLRGRPFPEVMRERIFEPLGMEHSDFERTPRVRERLAVGYQPARKGFKPVKDLEIVVGPAGVVLLDHRGHGALRRRAGRRGRTAAAPESLARMLEPQGEPDPDMPAMGLAFFLGRIGGHRVAGHDGGWPGFVSALAFAPAPAPPSSRSPTRAPPSRRTCSPSASCERLLEAPDGPRRAVPQHPHAWPELIGLYKLRAASTPTSAGGR